MATVGAGARGAAGTAGSLPGSCQGGRSAGPAHSWGRRGSCYRRRWKPPRGSSAGGRAAGTSTAWTGADAMRTALGGVGGRPSTDAQSQAQRKAGSLHTCAKYGLTLGKPGNGVLLTRSPKRCRLNHQGSDREQKWPEYVCLCSTMPSIHGNTRCCRLRSETVTTDHYDNQTHFLAKNVDCR